MMRTTRPRRAVAVDVKGTDAFATATKRVASALAHDEIAARLRAVIVNKSLRAVAAETRTCPETVRRYFGGAACSVDFMRRFCVQYGVSAEWLLFGRGLVHVGRERDRAQLHDATPRELLDEIGRRWPVIESEPVNSASEATT